MTPQKRQFLKKFLTDFHQIWSFDVSRIRHTKFCVDICNCFGVIVEKPGGGRFSPPPPRGARVYKSFGQHSIFSFPCLPRSHDWRASRPKAVRRDRDAPPPSPPAHVAASAVAPKCCSTCPAAVTRRSARRPSHVADSSTICN